MNKLNKKFKYGANRTFIILAVLAILIILNSIVDMVIIRVPSLKVDLTPEQYYELSEQTKDVLNNLTTDITVYFAKTPESADASIKTLNKLLGDTLDRYAAASNGRLTVLEVDILTDPQIAKQYDKDNVGISYLSTIFVNGSDTNKFLVVRPNEITTSLGDAIVEERYTSAILNITVLRSQKIYIADGIGISEDYGFEEFLKGQNYSSGRFNILTSDVPSDADLVILYGPKADLSVEAVNRLDKYLDRSGKVMVFYDMVSSKENAWQTLFPRLDAYLSEWGILRTPNLVLEADQNRAINGPSIFLADPNADYKGAKPIADKKLSIIAVQTNSIGLASVMPGNVVITPIVTSSKKSYIVRDTSGQVPDLQGPFHIGISAVKSKERGASANLIVFGSAQMFDSYTISQNSSNRDLIINTIAESTGNSEAITIRPKYTVDYSIPLTNGTQTVISVVVTVLLPLIFLVLGLIIWLRRRHL